MFHLLPKKKRSSFTTDEPNIPATGAPIAGLTATIDYDNACFQGFAAGAYRQGLAQLQKVDADTYNMGYVGPQVDAQAAKARAQLAQDIVSYSRCAHGLSQERLLERVRMEFAIQFLTERELDEDENL